MKKNPLEGKEIRMAVGVTLEPHCKVCKCFGFGFHIVGEKEKFDKRDVEGAGCPECGSEDLDWLPVGYSVGKIVMKKGWKAKRGKK